MINFPFLNIDFVLFFRNSLCLEVELVNCSLDIVSCVRWNWRNVIPLRFIFHGLHGSNM